MSILSNYLSKHLYYPSKIKKQPSSKLGMVVVIPCFNEENITGILDSLFNCHRPACDVEVIVVVNAPENTDHNVLEKNQKRINDFNQWTKEHIDGHLQFYALNYDCLPTKDAGVGLARKLGMDEAVNRFLLCQNIDGIIVNIDADCSCSRNYLVAIEKEFRNKKTKACSIRFEHPLEGDVYHEENYEAIIQYELYLHYYILSLRKIGHPFAFHTIGSSFAVRASVYAKQGGMNKRKAGEDFYFLQKVIPLGGYSELNDACVYPSPRSSMRVPFGTGASIDKMLRLKKNVYETYNIKAFEDLQHFFKKVEFYASLDDFNDLLYKVDEPIKSFLTINNFIHHMQEIKKNTASQKAFIQRFFRWFNAFMVLKYMNFCHEKIYQRLPVSEMVKKYLLRYENINAAGINDKELLMYLRKLIYKM